MVKVDDGFTELNRVMALPATGRRRMAQGRCLSRLAVEVQGTVADLTDSLHGMPEDPGLDHCLRDLRAMIERLARLGAERERGLLL